MINLFINGFIYSGLNRKRLLFNTNLMQQYDIIKTTKLIIHNSQLIINNS